VGFFISRRKILFSALGTGIAHASPEAVLGLDSMMWEYTLDYLELLDQRRKRYLESLSSPAELVQLQKRISATSTLKNKSQLHQNPLNTRHIETLKGSGVAVEKLIYESRPRFYVTANFYRPIKATGLLPTVVFSPGSDRAGKAAKAVQKFCTRLALSGFAVLTWDPITLGERRQMWNPDQNVAMVDSVIEEQRALGNQCYLLGNNLMDYRIWDAIRAIDYLETRPDIDVHRIAMAGIANGGEETLRVAPLEPRIKAIIYISAVLMTSRQRVATQLPVNPEQVYTRTLQNGIDHPELLAALAPRPIMIGSLTSGSMSVEETRSVFREISRIYSLLGVDSRVKLVETKDSHTLGPALSTAISSWLTGEFSMDNQDVIRTSHDMFDTFSEQDLHCTPTGQVANLFGAETIFTINKRQVRDSAENYPSPENLHTIEIYRNKIVNKIRRITKVGHFRPEAGIVVPNRVYGMEAFARGIAFVCADRGKDDPVVRRGVIDPLMAAGYGVIALDPRGWGESEPSLPIISSPYSREDFFAYRGVETGRPLLGQRIKDLLASASNRGGHLRWLVAGVGAGALVAAHAAALDPHVSHLIAVGGPISFRSLADDPLTKHPFGSFLPGVIGEYDLSDIYATLAPRKVLVLNPQDSQGELVPHHKIEKEFHWPQMIYTGAGAGGALSVETGLDPEKMRRLLGKWLKS
tara:strand:- start:14934 stop:17015 length:2082 start_codon:yes stop_codon:yes gene_type:complete